MRQSLVSSPLTTWPTGHWQSAWMWPKPLPSSGTGVHHACSSTGIARGSNSPNSPIGGSFVPPVLCARTEAAARPSVKTRTAVQKRQKDDRITKPSWAPRGAQNVHGAHATEGCASSAAWSVLLARGYWADDGPDDGLAHCVFPLTCCRAWVLHPGRNDCRVRQALRSSRRGKETLFGSAVDAGPGHRRLSPS